MRIYDKGFPIRLTMVDDAVLSRQRRVPFAGTEKYPLRENNRHLLPEHHVNKHADKVFDKMPDRNKKENMSLKPNQSQEKQIEKIKLLRLYRLVFNSLRKEEEESENPSKNRIDIEAYQVLKKSGKLIVNSTRVIGPISGVEIQDEFEFRVELIIVGLHWHTVHGIDYMVCDKTRVLATSIVATEGYLNVMVKPDMIIYTGEGGGLLEEKGKNAKDQELKRGNLALKNSMEEGNFIRVVRGVRPHAGYVGSSGAVRKTMYVYDGLYKVVDYGKVVGPYGKLIYQFKLLRCPGQKPIMWEKYK